MPRLFLGIPIPSSIKEELDYFKLAQNKYEGLGWTAEEKLHITAYFFAEVAEEMLDNLKSLLFIALKKQERFELKFEQFVLAPPRQAPRMIWARFKKSEDFLSLHEEVHFLYSQIEKSIQRRKKPIPHITLARLKEQAPKETLDYQLNLNCGNIVVDRLILWQSTLRPAGSVYEALEEYPLR
ncbi:MAG: RNA 2',3'-cyclic phosphodiesterase [Bacteroidota bacterium]